jgi:tRNA (uracil-5-)-methyltransferase
MLPYPAQLEHKRTIISKAYSHFSSLAASALPSIEPTVPSPMQYGYRTKLTPHFDAPPGARSARRNGVAAPLWASTPPIGFMIKNTRRTLDIEDCPIATDAVRQGLKSERARVAAQLNTYKKGATLLLRETTTRIPKPAPPDAREPPPNAFVSQHEQYTDYKSCVTDPNGTSTEYVGDRIFANPASAFFQNNNSILPVFTAYIREQLAPFLAPAPPSSTDQPANKVSHLIDAYSGSGLFTITLADLFESSVGIDIASSSIASAMENLELNGLAPTSLPHSGSTLTTPKEVSFLAADATQLFSSVTTLSQETAVILDPPRKGCDRAFLDQLMAYGAEVVVYVSCNVHTQARDVGVLVREGEYEVVSLRGFDFFPMTGHVEGVAVLKRGRGRDGGKRAGEDENKGEEGAPNGEKHKGLGTEKEQELKIGDDSNGAGEGITGGGSDEGTQRG